MEEEPLTTRDLADRAEDSHSRKVEGDLPADLQARAEESRKIEDADDGQSLVEPEQRERFRSRWESIQTRFVDEPRPSVEQADSLVAELMQQLTRTFADERAQLETQWERDEEVSTEELRIALTRYRSFFNRLLSA